MSDSHPPFAGNLPPPSGPARPGLAPPGSPVLPPESPKPGTRTIVAIVGAVLLGALALTAGILALTRSSGDPAATRDDSTLLQGGTLSPVTAPLITRPPVTAAPTSDLPVSAPPVTAPPVTAPPVTAPPVTAPPVTAPPDSTPTVGDELTSVESLLVWTSFSPVDLDDAQRQSAIDQLIVSRAVTAAASPTAVAVICAAVPVDVQLAMTIEWQYEGETVQGDVRDAAPPGTGACIDNGGNPLSAGSYQVLATDGDIFGFATTFVIGAAEVDQVFVNNSSVEICEIGVAPLSTAFYELFVPLDGPLQPAEQISITIASIDQDLRATDCNGDDFENFTFQPDVLNAQDLTP